MAGPGGPTNDRTWYDQERIAQQQAWIQNQQQLGLMEAAQEEANRAAAEQAAKASGQLQEGVK